jgi:hypothetical protein
MAMKKRTWRGEVIVKMVMQAACGEKAPFIEEWD